MHPFVAECSASLRATPLLLAAWLPHLPTAAVHVRESSESWSSLDIVRHLIYGEQTDWIPRLQLMWEHAGEKPPTFTPFDRAGHDQLPLAALPDLLQQFAELRSANLQTLEDFSFSDADLQIKGIHPALGEVNVRQLLSTWVVHDYTHLYQICRNLSSRYVQEVGPWFEYINILNQNF